MRRKVPLNSRAVRQGRGGPRRHRASACAPLAQGIPRREGEGDEQAHSPALQEGQGLQSRANTLRVFSASKDELQDAMGRAPRRGLGRSVAVRQLPLTRGPVLGGTFFILTLGCPKNEADTDALEARLRAAGHRPGAGRPRRHSSLVSTCGFIDAAKEESIAAILDARGGRARARRACGRRGLPRGALPRRAGRPRSPRSISGAGSTRRRCWRRWPGPGADPTRPRPSPGRRDRPRAPVSAYVKISDGCDRRCAFLRHPAHQGRLRDRGRLEVLRPRRARGSPQGRASSCSSGRTRRAGAQPGWGGMGRLLGELGVLEPAPAWLRLLYLQPDGITTELLEALAAHAVPYVDLPLQHASGARPAPHAAPQATAPLTWSCSTARGLRCPAPPCARPSSPGSPARPTPSSRSSSPS